MKFLGNGVLNASLKIWTFFPCLNIYSHIPRFEGSSLGVPLKRVNKY